MNKGRNISSAFYHYSGIFDRNIFFFLSSIFISSQFIANMVYKTFWNVSFSLFFQFLSFEVKFLGEHFSRISDWPISWTILRYLGFKLEYIHKYTWISVYRLKNWPTWIVYTREARLYRNLNWTKMSSQ